MPMQLHKIPTSAFSAKEKCCNVEYAKNSLHSLWESYQEPSYDDIVLLQFVFCRWFNLGSISPTVLCQIFFYNVITSL